ncbi:O-antigen ligase family protein [Ramlibacter sp. PS4R-6]|uniref:O-antigen ligase family protein n=1 Tax=Ramlibacter sp. PS4R-6 TaxID=3133438 RepID=UPI00309A9A88
MKSDRGTVVAALLAAAIAAAASLGVTHEGMLQDTFKSAVVACGALLAALVFVWPRSEAPLILRWHPVLLLPLLLAAYAFASMAWAHPWLAGVETVRWLVVALLACVALQVLHDEARRAVVARGVALGATVASLWVVLQFFFGLELFPQGARPASTFVNRNFFAEFAVCALPWFAWLVVRERRRGNRILIALAAGVVVLAIGMTGARAALVALGLLLASALLARPTRSWVLVALLPFVLLGTVPTGDARIAAEQRGDTAIARVFTRGAAIASRDEATTMRLDMWAATARTIADHPLAGVGAGSWEHEADYFAHNEFLQLVAEYGIVGWLFLAALVTWLVREVRTVDAWRAALLASLGALLVVSAAGFPWHLAATGAMFALGLGGLALPRGEISLSRRSSIATSAVIVVALVLAAYATVTAARAESRLARAARIALEIGGTSNPNDVRWLPAKSEMLRLADEGMRLHPHERLMTPLVADELGRWGDWPNAIRIWEHVLRSHPNVAPMLANVARGYTAIGRPDLAAPYAERARLLRQMSSSKG